VTPDLADQHLADLHELADELEVPGYRLLRRADLVAEIEARRGGPGHADEVGSGEDEPEEEDVDRGRGRGRRREPAGDEETEVVTGVLEITRQRYGFLRLAGDDPDPDDVYQPGADDPGPARSPRRGEKHRALVHVDLVNGEPPPVRDEADEADEDRDEEAA
jgi:transcription termination factor Rho